MFFTFTTRAHKLFTHDDESIVYFQELTIRNFVKDTHSDILQASKLDMHIELVVVVT